MDWDSLGRDGISWDALGRIENPDRPHASEAQCPSTGDLAGGDGPLEGPGGSSGRVPLEDRG